MINPEDILLAVMAKLDRIEGRLGRIEAFLSIQTDTMKPLIERLAEVEEGVDEILDLLPEPGDAELIDALNRLSESFEKGRSPAC